mgnify:CR=1 FL=1
MGKKFSSKQFKYKPSLNTKTNANLSNGHLIQTIRFDETFSSCNMSIYRGLTRKHRKKTKKTKKKKNTLKLNNDEIEKKREIKRRKTEKNWQNHQTPFKFSHKKSGKRDTC